MTTELTIGAINPGYGGLPIGVAAALGGATLAWHAHPGQPYGGAGRMLMRYHHPRAAAYTSIDVPPPMVDVLTINGFSDWLTSGGALIGGGYRPPPSHRRGVGHPRQSAPDLRIPERARIPCGLACRASLRRGRTARTPPRVRDRRPQRL